MTKFKTGGKVNGNETNEMLPNKARPSRLFYCCGLTFSAVLVVQGVIIFRLMQSENEEDLHRGNAKMHMIQPKIPVSSISEEAEPVSARPDTSVCGVGGDIAFYKGTKAGYWLCVHQHDDVISNRIRGAGIWDDCEDEVWLLWTLFGSDSRRKGVVSSRAWLKKERGQNAREQTATETGKSLVIVDVGANIGACSVRLAQLGHTVVSFEPLKENFLRLHGSVAINNLSSSLIAVNAGAAEAPGRRQAFAEQENMGNTLLMRGGGSGAGADKVSVSSVQNSTFTLHTVDVVRLDEFLGQLEPAVGAVDLLKLDCQGCELAALRGAAGLIEAGAVQLIVAEFSPAHLRVADHDPVELLEWLHMKGFAISTLVLGKEIAPAEFRRFVEQHQTRAVDIIARKATREQAEAKGGAGAAGVWPWQEREKRAGSDKLLFVLLCAFPIVFGCVGLYHTCVAI